MNLLEKLKQAYIKDDNGEVNLLTVMITVLMLMFCYLFIKAEVLNKAISETIAGSVVQLISIAFGGVGILGGIRKGVDIVNQNRQKNVKDTNVPNIDKQEEATQEVAKVSDSAYSQASKYVGLKEIEGDQHNPKIMEWVQKLGFLSKFGINSDEVPWCATFANGVLMEFGLTGSGSPRAKSFLDVGTKYNIGDKLPNKPFAIVSVSHRGYVSPNKKEGSGHVEIVDPSSITQNGYNSIGGNVSDQVKKMGRNYDRFFIEFRLIV